MLMQGVIKDPGYGCKLAFILKGLHCILQGKYFHMTAHHGTDANKTQQTDMSEYLRSAKMMGNLRGSHHCHQSPLLWSPDVMTEGRQAGAAKMKRE